MMLCVNLLFCKSVCCCGPKLTGGASVRGVFWGILGPGLLVEKKWKKKLKQCLSSLRTSNSFSFILFLSVNNTHTHKTSFLYHSQSFCLSFVNERPTHTRTKELSGNVLFSFFLWYSPLSSALTFIICLFVCFCFVLRKSYVAPALPLQRL